MMRFGTAAGWKGAVVVSMVASMCASFRATCPLASERRYPILTSNPARCSVVPCLNLWSDPGERTRHEAHALEDTLDVDVFCPPREDWLNKTDAYLRQK